MIRLWIKAISAFTACILFPSLFSISLFSSLPDEGEESRHRRWQIEVSGGISWLGAGDLNCFAEYERESQEFFYDRYLTYLQSTQKIAEWNKEQTGDWKKLQWGIPAGIRLRYRLNPHVSVSLGCSFTSGRNESEIEALFARDLNSYSPFEEKIQYNPFILEASAWSPLVGIHWDWILHGRWKVEGRLSAGPMISRCRFKSERNYQMHYVYEYSNALFKVFLFEKDERLELKGHGIGLALEAAGRLVYSLGRRIGVFIETAYAYQQSGRISGPGWEERGGVRREWEGEWYMKKETIVTPWGSLETEVPTNEPPGDREWEKAGEFHLQLSGLQVRIGIAYRF